LSDHVPQFIPARIIPPADRAFVITQFSPQAEGARAYTRGRIGLYESQIGKSEIRKKEHLWPNF